MSTRRKFLKISALASIGSVFYSFKKSENISEISPKKNRKPVVLSTWNLSLIHI